MLTDKQITRWTVKGWNDDHIELEDDEGKYVLYSDHVAVITAAEQAGDHIADVGKMVATVEQAQEAQPVTAGPHVAYFDDGQFHWMSGIRPRNCELYTSPTIPEGWQLVPIEPTEEMFFDLGDVCVNMKEGAWDAFKRTYRAMLEAAPKAKTETEEQ